MVCREMMKSKNTTFKTLQTDTSSEVFSPRCKESFLNKAPHRQFSVGGVLMHLAGNIYDILTWGTPYGGFSRAWIASGRIP